MALLISAVGKGPYSPSRYRVAGRDGVCETEFSVVATATLVGDVDRVTLLVTDGAVETARQVEGQLSARGIASSQVPVPVGRSTEEAWRIFRATVDSIPPSGDVRLDLTSGLRSLPFLLFASALYARALESVHLVAAHYGAFEAREGDVVPILDLSPILETAEWVHAVRSFRETGGLNPLARLFSERLSRARQARHTPRGLASLPRTIEDLAFSLPSALALDVAERSRGVLECLEKYAPSLSEDDPACPLIPLLRESLVPIAGAKGAREDPRLTLAELARQLRLARCYVEWGARDRALIVLREWVVSRSLLATDPQANWLKRETRLRQEALINGHNRRQGIAASPVAGATQPGGALTALWERLCEWRNKVAHGGITPQIVALPEGFVEAALELCETLLSDDPPWQPGAAPSAARGLVSALGRSAGVLYTAFQGIAGITDALVLASRETEARVPEVLSRLGQHPVIEIFSVEDANRCFERLPDLVEFADRWLVGLSHLTVNLTGGTTAMQFLVEVVAQRALRLGLAVDRVILVDRRDPEQQGAEPFVAGEVVTLPPVPRE